MLRKIFISILLLSALTSEGVIGIQSNIYNYLYANDIFNLSEDRNTQFEGVQGIKESESPAEAKYIAASDGLFSMSAGSLKGFSIEDVQGVLNYIPGERYLYYSLSNLVSTSFTRVDRKVITEKADSSPPVYTA